MLLVNDRSLLDGFRAGTRQALMIVYRHYQPRVAGYLRSGFSFHSGERVLRFRGYSQPWELETATHETLARAFVPAARMGYDGLRPFGDYVLAIARNYVLNELRKNDALISAGSAEEAEAEGAPPVDAPGATAPTIEEREVERLLTAFLADASPVELELFRRRFRDEQPQEEASAAMGMTRIVLRRVEHKLKRRLLDYLKRNGYLTGVSREILGAGLRSVLL